MPVYEYRCSGCGAGFELLRPMSRAQEEASCPKCKCASRRMPSRFASVAKDSMGNTAPVGGGSSCGSCSSSSCATCH